MKAISLCFSLACLVMVGCVVEDDLDTVEQEAIITSPDEEQNVIGGGDCGLDPTEQERNCPDNGGSNGTTCGRIGQACPPPPHMPHDSVCSYEQGSSGCVCRCFVPGSPALTSEPDEE